MKAKENIHLVIAITINLLLVWQLLKSTWEGNDKAVTFVIFFYPLLILMNALLWQVLRKHSNVSRVYKFITIGLIILFLPVLIMSTSY
ncbi:hypothetical protein WG947_12140 [Pontibacter sp. H259]|uniref:hypothetical protein n=1 Tax=Pontibacter sp. H259 TaxID=3133421 RepID=UPI0030BCD47A